MTALSLFVLVVFVTGAYSAPNSRILGGSPARIEDYPGMVQVQGYYDYDDFWYTFCGGTILNEIYIVSAAHCFEELLHEDWEWVVHDGYRRIKAGSKDLNVGGVDSIVELVHMHPDYNPEWTGLDDDIALARLKTPLVFTSVIQPVAIVPQGYVVPDRSELQYAGWGELFFQKPGPDELHHVTVPKINHAECQERYGEVIISPRQICAGSPGKDACVGDSGGPLLLNGILVGIISWGPECGLFPSLPGVNARVASYTDWILATTEPEKPIYR